MSDEYVVVGRVGRAHGIRGEVLVEPRTDEPDRRFVAGAVLRAEGRVHWSTLTVVGARTHQGRLSCSGSRRSPTGPRPSRLAAPS